MSNANAARPELEIELDRKRKMVFDFNSLCKIEQVTGKNALFDLSIWQKPSATDLRALIWAGFSSDDPSLTIEQTGQLIAAHGPKIKEIISFAFKNAVDALALEKKSDAPKVPTT